MLKGIVDSRMYEHYLGFSIAMRILTSVALCQQHADLASDLLKDFVCKGIGLYGVAFAVYNTHSLLHLAADARHYGSLDNCSAFAFENHLQVMKKMVRGRNNPERGSQCQCLRQAQSIVPNLQTMPL